MKTTRFPDSADIENGGAEVLYLDGFTVSTCVGADGVPVVQVDGMGSLRVNVNDGPVFDQHTESPSRIPYGDL